MLQYSIPPKTNAELQKLVDSGDKETIIFSHLRLAWALARKFGRDIEYFDAAVFGLVLGIERLKDLPHDNITGYLVHWMNQHIRKVENPLNSINYVPAFNGSYTESDLNEDCNDGCSPVDFSGERDDGQSKVDLYDQLSTLSDLDQAIISMKSSGFTNEEVCEHLGTTQWFIQKAKSHLGRVLIT